MAYFSQERKKEKAPKIKAIFKKYGIKGSLAVDNHSTFVINIKSGKIDFLTLFNKRGKEDLAWKHPDWKWEDSTYIDVNPYHYKSHFENNPTALAFLTELFEVANEGNHDNSDAMTDYFDVGWYVDINIGTYRAKGYQFEG